MDYGEIGYLTGQIIWLVTCFVLIPGGTVALIWWAIARSSR